MARKILLADDSVTAQNMGRKILADAGYEVIAVNNGSAALKKIIELKPDLVILDVYMPGYSGLEVCQRLKESPETARIPVLLTVGKLEPFKPEEAQRVRAEGFVVKPFEASELLSALSKLEDKVVPRPEPSKPGRFARAIASVESAGSDAGTRNAPSSSETGWKSRIGFPSKKTEPESSPAPETRIDVAAFGPIGIPKDVTPAEVAAITAAAAQIQMAEAAAKSETAKSEEHRAEESAQETSEPVHSKSSVKNFDRIPAARGEFSVEPSLERFEDSQRTSLPSSAGTPAGTSASPEPEAASQQFEGVSSVSSAVPAEFEKPREEQSIPEPQDAPVTMAVASQADAPENSASQRWTAVSVALGADESSISLEQEMQKAYAAFAPADYATSAGAVEAAPAATQVTPEPAAIEAQPEAASTVEPQPVAESQPAPEVLSSEPASPVDSVSEPFQPVAQAEISAPAMELAAPAAVPEPIAEAAGEDKAASSVPEIQAVAEIETTTPASVSELREEKEQTESVSAGLSSPKADPDAVRDTAAAWASWRQIRDAGNSQEPAPQSESAANPEPDSSDTAALAVAAGAEHPLPEPAPANHDHPQDVASIVDSVLAGLRPKLMEEITRKMAEKK